MNRKKTLKLVVVIFMAACGCFATSSHAQFHARDWTAFKVANDSALGVHDLFFADSATGYLCLNYFLQSNGQARRWYRTLDGGVSWQQIVFSGINPWDTDKVDSYQCSTPSPNSVFLATTRLFYSLDRGLHWDTTSQSINFSKPFAMFTEKEGIAVGGVGATEQIIKTTTGVHGFAPIGYDSLFDRTIQHDDWLGPIFFPAGAFSSPDLGCIIVADGSTQKGQGLSSLVTTNGGQSWNKYNTVFPGRVKDTLYGDVQFQKGTPNVWEFPQRQRWAQQFRTLGLQPCNITYCFSTDCGVSWAFDTSFSMRWTTVFGVEPGNVWMTLHDTTSKNSILPAYTIAHTTDYGNSWDLDSISPYIPDVARADCRAFYFLDKSHGWLAALVKHHSYDPYAYPYVFRYTPQSLGVVVEHNRNISYNKLNQVYPNPCSSSVQISSWQPVVKIDIYDFYGRHVIAPATIVGSSITIDSHELGNGVWFAILSHAQGFSTARFIVQK